MSYESLHEKLAQLDAELSSDEDQDKTSTRDKLETGEAELAKGSLEASALTKKLAETETKTRTRERLADVEKQLSHKLRLENCTSTRERLAEAEKQLSMRTSTKTRERLVEAERKLAEMKTKTSTRTRDDLRRVEEEIARERARAASNYQWSFLRGNRKCCGRCWRRTRMWTSPSSWTALEAWRDASMRPRIRSRR